MMTIRCRNIVLGGHPKLYRLLFLRAQDRGDMHDDSLSVHVPNEYVCECLHARCECPGETPQQHHETGYFRRG